MPDSDNHFFAVLEAQINGYIEQCQYTWTFEKVIEEYEKYSSGHYVSFTTKDIIKKFEEELKRYKFITTTKDNPVVYKAIQDTFGELKPSVVIYKNEIVFESKGGKRFVIKEVDKDYYTK